VGGIPPAEPSDFGSDIFKQTPPVRKCLCWLAREAGVACNTIVKIESGENKNPTIETLRSIARALNVDLNDPL
jgi:DNA-binding phage protein